MGRVHGPRYRFPPPKGNPPSEQAVVRRAEAGPRRPDAGASHQGGIITTIAAKVAPNGKVKIAWDAQTTGTYVSKSTNKVELINDQFAVGVAGHRRYANILHRTSVNKVHPYDIAQSDFDGYGWVLDEVIPSWMKAVKKEKDNSPYEDEELPWGHALIALAGKIYRVGSDFAVCQVGDFGAIGSGAPYASTALHLGKTVRQAVQIATDLDIYSGGEVKEMSV